VRIVAPSGPFDAATFQRGIERLAARYQLAFDESIHSRHGFLAGDDERRRAELDQALSDPDARAILIARGGYGLSRIVDRVDLSQLRRHPKWVVGFSDATLLHLEAQRQGISSLHGPNVTGIGSRGEEQWEQLREHLEAPTRVRTHEGLLVIAPGQAQGQLHGGNLSLLHAAAAAGRLQLPDSAIVFLEEVAEAPYRIDRMLTSLVLGGAFDRVAGFVVGQLHECKTGPYEVPAQAVMAERLSLLRVPVLLGLPCGHGEINAPLGLGLPARIANDGVLF
jgi:muramoyltetrapeptide carboxypeptidase